MPKIFAGAIGTETLYSSNDDEWSVYWSSNTRLPFRKTLKQLKERNCRDENILKFGGYARKVLDEMLIDTDEPSGHPSLAMTPSPVLRQDLSFSPRGWSPCRLLAMGKVALCRALLPCMGRCVQSLRAVGTERA